MSAADVLAGRAQWAIEQGDVLDRLAALPDESVNCVVTSPPYWGLRDYGVDGQIGLEPTPDAYVARMVAVFAEVRRVLRSDGTCWVNLGDAYATRWGSRRDEGRAGLEESGRGRDANTDTSLRSQGLKEKDLVGIPWRVAFALQQPHYTGKITSEADRIWLAAMIDAEGCMFIHRRKEGMSNGQGYVRKADSFSAGLEVSNVHEAIVQRCMAITGLGSVCTQGPNENHRRVQTIFRWSLRANVCRDVVREVYPYLVAKQHEARILLGCPSSGPKADAAHVALKALHNGEPTDIDFSPPASMYEPGWYLRSDCIWQKPNPMPESVTDRPTRSHEYLFLLTRSARYAYDAAAIAEPVTGGAHRRTAYKMPDGWDTGPGGHGSFHRNGREKGRPGVTPKSAAPGQGIKANESFHAVVNDLVMVRNKRTVWEIPSEPYPDAHFATMPTALVEPCILAGCPVGGVVLDPFAGSGTVILEALRHGRRGIGIDLSPAYVAMARRRVEGDCPMFNTEAAG